MSGVDTAVSAATGRDSIGRHCKSVTRYKRVAAPMRAKSTLAPNGGRAAAIVRGHNAIVGTQQTAAVPALPQAASASGVPDIRRSHNKKSLAPATKRRATAEIAQSSPEASTCSSNPIVLPPPAQARIQDTAAVVVEVLKHLQEGGYLIKPPTVGVTPITSQDSPPIAGDTPHPADGPPSTAGDPALPAEAPPAVAETGEADSTQCADTRDATQTAALQGGSATTQEAQLSLGTPKTSAPVQHSNLGNEPGVDICQQTINGVWVGPHEGTGPHVSPSDTLRDVGREMGVELRSRVEEMREVLVTAGRGLPGGTSSLACPQKQEGEEAVRNVVAVGIPVTNGGIMEILGENGGVVEIPGQSGAMVEIPVQSGAMVKIPVQIGVMVEIPALSVQNGGAVGIPVQNGGAVGMPGQNGDVVGMPGQNCCVVVNGIPRQNCEMTRSSKQNCETVGVPQDVADTTVVQCQPVSPPCCVESNRAEIRTLQKQLAELQQQNQHLALLDNDGTLTWSIEDFSRLREDAASGRTPFFDSQPFYSDKAGYKLCGRIFLDGVGSSKGRHISLFIVLQRGRYDAILDWPFRRSVTFSVLNQISRDDDIITSLSRESFPKDSPHSPFRRPKADPAATNERYGCEAMIGNEQLYAKQGFVKDNILFVKIVVHPIGHDVIHAQSIEQDGGEMQLIGQYIGQEHPIVNDMGQVHLIGHDVGQVHPVGHNEDQSHPIRHDLEQIQPVDQNLDQALPIGRDVHRVHFPIGQDVGQAHIIGYDVEQAHSSGQVEGQVDSIGHKCNVTPNACQPLETKSNVDRRKVTAESRFGVLNAVQRERGAENRVCEQQYQRQGCRVEQTEHSQKPSQARAFELYLRSEPEQVCGAASRMEGKLPVIDLERDAVARELAKEQAELYKLSIQLEDLTRRRAETLARKDELMRIESIHLKDVQTKSGRRSVERIADCERPLDLPGPSAENIHQRESQERTSSGRNVEIHHEPMVGSGQVSQSAATKHDLSTLEQEEDKNQRIAEMERQLAMMKSKLEELRSDRPAGEISAGMRNEAEQAARHGRNYGPTARGSSAPTDEQNNGSNEEKEAFGNLTFFEHHF